MDIEQLKLILDTLSTAGEGAFVIGILWVCESYFSSLLVSLTLGGIIYLGLKAIRENIAMECSKEAAKQALSSITGIEGYWCSDEEALRNKLNAFRRHNPDLKNYKGSPIE